MILRVGEKSIPIKTVTMPKKERATTLSDVKFTLPNGEVKTLVDFYPYGQRGDVEWSIEND